MEVRKEQKLDLTLQDYLETFTVILKNIIIFMMTVQ